MPLIINFSLKIKYAILFLIVFCFYASSFPNQYALDDEAVIQTNNYVQKGFAGIGKILTSDAYDCYYKHSNANQHLSGGRYRPLSIVLFAVEHQLWGESPSARHIVNVLLYIFCVLVIFYFLRNYLFKKTSFGEDIAFISTLLFAIHPLHTEVVANIKSSDEILSLLFILLTFIFSLEFRETKKIKNLIAGLTCLFLALLAKEYALTLLLLLPLLFMLYFKDKMSVAVRSSFPYYGIILLYLILRIASIGFPHQQSNLDILNNPYLFATPLQKLASQIFILGKYLWMLFFPYPLAYDYGFAQISYYSFFNPLVWLTIFIYSLLIYQGVKLFRKRNILAFPVFFFLLNLFMVSNLVINIGATMGERLAFHSSLGFVILISQGIVYLTKALNMAQRRIAVILFLDVLIVLCGAETINRNSDWKNDFTLFTKDVNIVPRSVKANDNAGAQYINLSETIKDSAQSDSIARKGLKYLYKAVSLDDSDINGLLNLGIGYCKLVKPDSAKYFWDKVKKLNPSNSNLPGYYPLLGQIFLYTGTRSARQGNYSQAIHNIESGIECAPSNPDLWYNLGGTFFNFKVYDSARLAWIKTAKINPNYPNINNVMAMLPKPYQSSNSSPGFK